MMSLLFFFTLLLIPPLISRSFVLERRADFTAHRMPELLYLTTWGVGLSQDFFILIEQFIPFLLFKSLFPQAFVFFFWGQFFLTLFLELDILFDLFLFSRTSIRMETSFFSFADDLRSFWDSAKEKGFGLFVFVALGCLGLHITLFLVFKNSLRKENFPPYFYSHLFMIALPGIVGSIFLPKKISYMTDNIVFQQQKTLIYKFASYLMRRFRKSPACSRSHGEKFAPKHERSTYLSDSYPLLKFTRGFFGARQCPITVAADEKPHVIFLFMESFRARDVGTLGGMYGVTPQFDQLAREGYLFSNFYANSIKTSRSAAASLFGIPSDLTSADISDRVDVPFISIADMLRKQSYRTAYIHNGILNFENQLEFFTNYGFENVIGRNSIREKFPNAPLTSWGVHDEYLMRYSVDWLEEKDKEHKPYFMTLFTISNHHPWRIPPGYKPPSFPRHLPSAQRRYLETFHYSDHCLGLFIRLLKERNLSKKTVLFIMGDHGQPMGEHECNFVEQRSLYEENVHIPLLIYAEDRIQKPAMIEDLSSQIDLFPTVMDLLNLKGINHSVGTTLLRKSKSRQVYFHNPYVFGFYGTRKNAHKYIQTLSTKEQELYDVVKDPYEQKNLAHENLKLSENLLEDVTAYREYFQRIYENRLFAPKEFVHESCYFDIRKKKDLSLEALFSELNRVSYLIHLNLSNLSGLMDKHIEEMVQKHIKLQKIELQGIPTISDRGVQTIAETCHALTALNISDCPLLTDAALQALFTSALSLEEIVASHNADLTNDAFRTLNKVNPKILRLSLLGCNQITEKGWGDIVKMTPNLEELALSCRNLADEDLEKIFSYLPKLTKLFLGDAEEITGSAFRSLVTNCPALHFLHIHVAHGLEDASLKELQNCTNLNYLFLEEAKKLSDAGMQHLSSVPVRCLYLRNVFGISPESVEHLKRSNKKLKYLDLNDVCMFSSNYNILLNS